MSYQASQKTTINKTLLEIYHEEVTRLGYKQDPLQIHAIEALGALRHRLEAEAGSSAIISKVRSLFGQKTPSPDGVYIFGPVGCGKSFMMDLFFKYLDRADKKRVHFHEFMLSVHDFAHQHRAEFSMNEALPRFATAFSKQCKILCFDEFHVTDIADAMILKRLFTELWARGVVMVSTSNWAPDDLYKDGLQRDLFLPFIDILKDKSHVLDMHGGTDYRQEKIRDKKRYFWPLDDYAHGEMNQIFDVLAQGDVVESKVLKIKGHDFKIPQAAGQVARFQAHDLINKNYAAIDFLKLADHFSAIMIDNMPKLKDYETDLAKRFMVLIDALYDKGVHLIISAAVAPEKLYQEGRLAFEFERTVSRLREMQSKDYISKH